MKSPKFPQPLKIATFAAILAAGAWYVLDRPISAPSLTFTSSSEAPEVAQVASAVPQGPEAQPSVEVPVVGDTLFAAPSRVTGQRLDVKSAAYMQSFLSETKPPGRTGDVDPTSIEKIGSVDKGETVHIPLFAGETVEGVVGVVDTEDEGVRRIGGRLAGERPGTFYFSTDGKDASGFIRLTEEKVTYELVRATNGRLQLAERPMVNTECLGMPRVAANKAKPPRAQRGTPQPIFNSRPDAPACFFLDYDGVIVNDPAWAPVTLDCAPTGFTDAQIKDSWMRVAEDYLQFNINVTTDPAVYKSTPVGSRMRCVITGSINGQPASSYITGVAVGGVAYLNSFARAGKVLGTPPNTVGLKKNVPCWVFEDGTGNDPKYAADAIAHEGGHTFGLLHDGTVALGPGSYYDGQGTGPTSWGPIMGAPYNRALNQWSIGEYSNANNREDDIAIISNTINGFGIAPDDFGNSIATAAPITFINGYIEQRGVIGGQNDADVFSVTLPRGGNFILSVNGLGNRIGDCDVRIDLLDSTGAVVVKSTFDRTLGAAFVAAVPAGKYFLRVRASGEGDVNAVGYSRYGSAGSYTIAGKLP